MSKQKGLAVKKYKLDKQKLISTLNRNKLINYKGLRKDV